MYTRIAHYRYDPTIQEDFWRVTREELVPTLQRLPGFHGYLATEDHRAPGRGVAVTLWATEDQAAGVGAALAEVGYKDDPRLGIAIEQAHIQRVVVRAGALTG
jgi:heme-degrading monooxygenase HmoA